MRISKLPAAFMVAAMLCVVCGAHAVTPREQLQFLTAQLQQAPTDDALRDKLIKLSITLKPAPAIPEFAREPFVMGATVLKKADDPAGAIKAVDLFTQAINVAPWFADAYYNRSVAHEAAGQFDGAISDLRFYLAFTLSEADRRSAQDKVYALKVDAQLAAEKKAEQDKVDRAAADKAQAAQARRDVIERIKAVVGGRYYSSSVVSYSRDQPYYGVNQYELFGGGTYYMFDQYSQIYWKYFDDHVELWGAENNGSQSLALYGESTGPQISDMQWFWGKGDNTKSETQQVWAYLDTNSGYLYTSSALGRVRPLRDSDFDTNARYTYYLYKPR